MNFSSRNLEVQASNNSNEIIRLKREKEVIQKNLETTLALQKQEQESNQRLKGEIAGLKREEGMKN